MEIKKLSQFEKSIDEIINSIKYIIWRNFPELPGEEKEDIAQEIHLKLWKMISSGRKIHNLRSYLWKAVHTTAIDIICKKINNMDIDARVHPNQNEEFSSNNFLLQELSINDKDSKFILEKAIKSLSQNRRIVIKLRLLGMNIREMAELLGWTESKANHLYYRGLEDLEGILKSLGYKNS
ncbi:RNA polymerase sigma factor [Acidobacteriota bacterium]